MRSLLGLGFQVLDWTLGIETGRFLRTQSIGFGLRDRDGARTLFPEQTHAYEEARARVDPRTRDARAQSNMAARAAPVCATRNLHKHGTERGFLTGTLWNTPSLKNT